MKNYLSYRSISTRALLALVLFMAGGSLVVRAASFCPEATNTASQRTLTFADRVPYQRAVEEVYWLRRIWPKENQRPKPSLNEVMSQEQIERKVEAHLRDSQLLADQWRRPITPEQLQAEINRMARHTRQPEVLRELFAPLDDPFIIAERLAINAGSVSQTQTHIGPDLIRHLPGLDVNATGSINATDISVDEIRRHSYRNGRYSVARKLGTLDSSAYRA